MKHANISIFIPHIGCPHTCSFCNQRAISGVTDIVSGADVTNIVTAALQNNPKLNKNTAQIAFFGGSFTAVPKEYMVELLEAAYSFVKAGKVEGIRISTRPDYIDEEVLVLLKHYGVTAIELGAQSMSDKTLLANGRGHTADDVVRASELIRETEFSLGLQMMLGLHQDNSQNNYYTAEQFVLLQPDTVRIYPTLVLQDTYLAELFDKGEYKPMELATAVDISKDLLKLFTKNNIQVIKLGLHPDKDMQTSLLAGPFHPAFKQLVESALYFDEMVLLLKDKPKGDYTILVNKGQLSNGVGNKKENLEKLMQLGYNVKVQESEVELETLCTLAESELF